MSQSELEGACLQLMFTFLYWTAAITSVARHIFILKISTWRHFLSDLTDSARILCNSPAGFVSSVTATTLMIAFVMFSHLWHAECTFWCLFLHYLELRWLRVVLELTFCFFNSILSIFSYQIDFFSLLNIFWLFNTSQVTRELDKSPKSHQDVEKIFSLIFLFFFQSFSTERHTTHWHNHITIIENALLSDKSAMEMMRISIKIIKIIKNWNTLLRKKEKFWWIQKRVFFVCSNEGLWVWL